MLLEIHCHSNNSPDSKNSIRDIIKTCEKKGIDAIAITDHDVPFDTRQLKGINTGVIVIPSIEVSSEDDSHIIGLYVKRPINSKRMIDIIREIHRQGGIAVLVHPHRKWQGYLTQRISRSTDEVEDVLREIDCVEIYNAKSNPDENRMAQEFFKDKCIPILGGSDAHTLSEIGNVLVRLWCEPARLRTGITKARRELVIDRAVRLIDYAGFKVRKAGKKVMLSLGVNDKSRLYTGLRDNFKSGIRHIKKVASRK